MTIYNAEGWLQGGVSEYQPDPLDGALSSLTGQGASVEQINQMMINTYASAQDEFWQKVAKEEREAFYANHPHAMYLRETPVGIPAPNILDHNPHNQGAFVLSTPSESKAPQEVKDRLGNAKSNKHRMEPPIITEHY